MQEDKENTFKILLATDNHLGCHDRHPLRDQDSYVAFEEILKIALREEVDFILLGGDLFHSCKPSPYCVQKCSELIKRYCFGDRPISIQFLSDQSFHFKQLKNPIVNYEDPNLNIQMPIFSIHGNHDDPTTNKSMSPMDLLATNGLLNYFGRWVDLSHVDVHPMLLQKGETFLALYGLSHMHDQRLARLFRDEKVTVFKPPSENNWFNLMVTHQNRVPRGPNNFIPPSFLPDFMDLVMWGHEHDCLIEPEKQENGVYITQPGSSVATSLSEGESGIKKVGLLYINKQQFRMESIPLKTVRPFVFKTITLDEPADIKSRAVTIETPLSEYSVKVVTEAIEEILNDISRERNEQGLPSMLPLVRIVVRYHDENQQFNAIRVSQTYTSRVANPDDIIIQKEIIDNPKARRNRFINPEIDYEDDDVVREPSARVRDIVDKIFKEANDVDKMTVLSITGLGEALTKFIDYGDSDAMRDVIDHQISTTEEELKKFDLEDLKDIDKVIKDLQGRRDDNEEVSAVNRLFNDPDRASKRKTMNNDITEICDDDDDNVTLAADTSFSPRRPARGPGSRGGRVGRRGRRAKAT